MGFYKYNPLIVVPASRVAAFNNVMERHGYGEKFLDKSRRNAVIGINDDPLTKDPTHHFLTCPADDGLWAALCEALKKANQPLPVEERGLRRQRFMREVTKKRVRQILENAQLKRKSKEDEDAEEAAGQAHI